MNAKFIPQRTIISAALLALVATLNPVFAQTTPPDDTPVVVVEDRSLRERVDQRDLTLENPLALVDAAGDPILTLPVGTLVGREKIESRFAAENQLIRQRTDLRNVTLTEAVIVTNRATGESVTLPAGTVLRVKLDQRFDAAGNVVRDRIDIRAVRADGTRLRIRDRAPEVEVNDVENEMGDRHRQRGRDMAKPEDNSSGDRSSRVERSGSDRSGRAERSERGGRMERAERSERSGRMERAERTERSEHGDRSGRH